MGKFIDWFLGVETKSDATGTTINANIWFEDETDATLFAIAKPKA